MSTPLDTPDFLQCFVRPLPFALVGSENRNVEPKPALLSTATVPPRSWAVHPSPDQQIAIGWQSPLAGRVRVSLRVSDGHPGGGNGVDWAVVHRQAIDERLLAEGYVKEGGSFPDGDGRTVVGEFDVQPGEFVSLIIAAHEHQHACDTTICDLTIAEIEGQGRIWNVAEQLQNRIHLSNPLADILGNRSVWHFFTVSDTDKKPAVGIALRSSLLGRWTGVLHGQNDSKSLRQLAAEIQLLFLSAGKSAADIDKRWRDDLLAPAGPLFAGAKLDVLPDEKAKAELASLTAEFHAVRSLAAQPLPPLPPGSEQRYQESLRQMVWAMLMSSEFRFNH